MVVTATALSAMLVLTGCQTTSVAKEVSKLATERNEEAPRRTLRSVDGGLDYFKQFSNPLPSSPGFFPVGVWLESIHSQEDIRRDNEAGINVYVDLTADSNLNLLDGDTPFALSSSPSNDDNGAVLADEPDMWAGPGDATWTGNWPGQGPACEPDGERCGYTLQKQLAAGVDGTKMKYANYGKGVTFWETDQEAARFINEFQDVVSADNYWFTDPNICGLGEGARLVEGERALSEGECRLAANYGWTVDRVRSLVSPQGSKPVWSFVELGQPFDASTEAATGPQIRAAVWSSIIHGARGIVYFNHSFGGDCRSFHVLRERCAEQIRADVTAVNMQVAELAPALNAPFLDGAIQHGDSVHSAVKIHDGSLVILAGAAQAAAQETLFELPCLAKGGGAVTVLYEDRTISMEKGTFRDTFADGNAVHLYLIEGAGPLCTP
ncbi:hypothetical protein D7Z96_13565 [Pseudarthrobacter phenanthrenivorans]|uniref:Glycoside hydrolase family 42 N-terminal domain-containing protein n=1 Tax=Pseudarthrobacter phenanthrenivorans TaxID=361575 RepID=A0A3B0FSK1_PSEPS|nr:hypothetical protein D7Z96_13565 [Pseudarthrobacter phenanthrenivorans]